MSETRTVKPVSFRIPHNAVGEIATIIWRHGGTPMLQPDYEKRTEGESPQRIWQVVEPTKSFPHTVLHSSDEDWLQIVMSEIKETNILQKMSDHLSRAFVEAVSVASVIFGVFDTITPSGKEVGWILPEGKSGDDNDDEEGDKIPSNLFLVIRHAADDVRVFIENPNDENFTWDRREHRDTREYQTKFLQMRGWVALNPVVNGYYTTGVEFDRELGKADVGKPSE